MATSSLPKFDTHALAFKLLIEQAYDEQCGEDEEKNDPKKVRHKNLDVSEHGQEARTDFYQNRSRSDGASTVMKNYMVELRKKQDQGQNLDESNEEDTPGVVSPTLELKIVKETSQVAGSVIGFETTKIGGPARAAQPVLRIPQSDSSECLFKFDDPNAKSPFMTERRFVPYFSPPFCKAAVYCLLEQRQICLESFESTSKGISGSILVKYPPGIGDCSKRVFIRHTTNSWLKSDDAEAEYIESIPDHFRADRFSFHVPIGSFQTAPGCKLEFALACEIYSSPPSSLWDNNNGVNYACWYSA